MHLGSIMEMAQNVQIIITLAKNQFLISEVH